MSGRNSSAAPATPPHAAGLSAASGEAPQGVRVPDTQAGFEAFWNSYAHKQQRAKAKAAWAKLDPDTELAATIIIEAARWAEHYAKHNVEPRWRVLPHNWLAGENWLQDLPIVHTDRKSAAIANVRGSAKQKPCKQTSQAKPGKASTPTTARITAAEVVEDGGIAELHFTATDDVGAEHQYVIVLQHDDAETQFAGQRELAKLVNAAGLEQIEDSAELMGRSIVMTGESFTAPTTRPDDEPPLPVKPEPVRYADTVSEHSIEPPADYGTKAWERRYTARQVGNAARKQWDKAHPQMFEDTLPPPPDDWPEWLDAEFEQDDAA